MDDETLAPMADALSATLAVIVLLICFFILAQVVAVSKQIETQKLGEEKYLQHQLDIAFKELRTEGGQLRFYKSFNTDDSSTQLVSDYLNGVKANCFDCESFKIISNYPAANASKHRSQRRGLSNAIKLIPYLVKEGMKYEIELSNDSNYYFLEVEPIENK
ncbi:hypothetical protein OTK49_01170 [Vibrio coralliirubri]|uniref:hypothetical protein n=1 Tax=Vibrio coralliirubri TaxID=1516159 RepID=UPI00228331C9|nr:hypothetical protein [Vibrio coralliirubri]MCY9861140.1 hypothetical protein [Vibrio coralliirubri]